MEKILLKIKPRANTLFVEKDVKPKKEGLIYYPSFNKVTQKEDRKTNTGTIIAVGELHPYIEYKFKPNDRVFFGKYAGVPFIFEGRLLYLMLIEEIKGYFTTSF